MIVPTHDRVTKAVGRPPGVPPSECRGELVGVPLGDSLFAETRDGAQVNEGPVGAEVAVELYHCTGCGCRLVLVDYPDHQIRLRNAYGPVERPAIAPAMARPTLADIAMAGAMRLTTDVQSVGG